MAKKSGLRKEILTTLILLMGGALLLGGVLMLRLLEQSLLEQKVDQLRLMSSSITRSLAESYEERGQVDYNLEILKKLPEELLYSAWWLYGSDMTLIASLSDGRVKPFPDSRRQQSRIVGQSFEEIKFPTLLSLKSEVDTDAKFLMPIFQQGSIRGVLEIHYSLDDIRYRLLVTQRTLFVYILLFGSVLIGIGYYLLQRNVIKPANNLLEATQSVSRGDYQTRLELAGPREIAQLAEAYNQMVEALQQSRAETESHIETLEQTNHELQRAKDELVRSEKMASVGQLAAGLAHELGNPLTALIGYLELLKTRLKDNDLEVIASSIAEAERIDFLVRELLNFSRPTDGEKSSFDPVDEIRKTIALLNNQGVFSEVSLQENMPEKMPWIFIDRNKFQQVVVNLILNAIQACHDKGEVAISAAFDDTQVWFEIKDSGKGIPFDLQTRIFDPFFTTKSPGEGTGLGLAICHRIIEEAGGEIVFESDEGEGSTFKVRLPVTGS